MNMLFYFEFSYIQIFLNIYMNELLFCKLISNTIYVYIYIYIYMFACTCVNVMSNVIFTPFKSGLGSITDLWE